MNNSYNDSYEGVFPVIPAPFSNDGEYVDYLAWERLIIHAIDVGSSGIAIFGAGTEFYKLSASEKSEMLRIAVSLCKDKLPVLVTISNHATNLAVKEAKQAVSDGAAIINIFPPSFASPSPNSIIRHITCIAKAVDVPVMVQYAPELTGQKIDLDVFAKISQETKHNLLIKVEANPTGPTISAIHTASNGGYTMAVGNAGLYMYDALVRGARIIMPGLAMVELYISFYHKFITGNIDKAYDTYKELLPYIVALGQDNEIFVSLEKKVLMKKGFLSNSVCREPNRIPDETTVGILMKCLKKIL